MPPLAVHAELERAALVLFVVGWGGIRPLRRYVAHGLHGRHSNINGCHTACVGTGHMTAPRAPTVPRPCLSPWCACGAAKGTPAGGGARMEAVPAPRPAGG